MVQALNHFHGSSLDLIHCVHISPDTGHSSPGVVKVEGSTLPSSQLSWLWTLLGCSSTPLAKRHTAIAGSSSSSCSPELPDPFLQSCFWSVGSQHVVVKTWVSHVLGTACVLEMLQQFSGWLFKGPMRTWTCECEAYPSYLKKDSSTSPWSGSW